MKLSTVVKICKEHSRLSARYSSGNGEHGKYVSVADDSIQRLILSVYSDPKSVLDGDKYKFHINDLIELCEKYNESFSSSEILGMIGSIIYNTEIIICKSSNPDVYYDITMASDSGNIKVYKSPTVYDSTLEREVSKSNSRWVFVKRTSAIDQIRSIITLEEWEHVGLINLSWNEKCKIAEILFNATIKPSELVWMYFPGLKFLGVANIIQNFNNVLFRVKLPDGEVKYIKHDPKSEFLVDINGVPCDTLGRLLVNTSFLFNATWDGIQLRNEYMI